MRELLLLQRADARAQAADDIDSAAALLRAAMCLGKHGARLQMQLQRTACDGGETGQQAGGDSGGRGGDLAHDNSFGSRVNYLGNNPHYRPELQRRSKSK
jgi:hypothetical protein